MSTTIKRVALVAVAALGLGVLTVAPSQATINADTVTLSATTAAQTTAETKTATSAVLTVSFLGAANDSLSVTASLVSGPTGNVALPRLALVETSSAKVNNSNLAVGSVIEPNQPASTQAGVSTAVTTAKYAVYLGTDSLTAPTVAGTYVVKLTPATVGSSGAINATAQTLTITVTTAAALDTVAASATSILNVGETTSATVDATVNASKAVPASNASTTSVATIKVALKNAAGSAVTAESYTATITGPGLLGSGTGLVSASDIGATATGRAISVKYNDVVGVFADGTAGVSTITITSAAGVVLATEKVTFFGDATKIVAAANALDEGSVGSIGDSLKLIKFNVYDAAGVEINTGTYYVVTDSLSVANTTAYRACDATYDTTYKYFTCQVTGVAKGTANLYVTNRASATATTPTTEIKSNSVAIRVGSKKAASVSVTLDKSSYAPGEKATLTVAFLDADGLAVSSGDYASIFASTYGITANYTMGNGSDTTTTLSYSGAYATIDGVYEYTLYMPVTEGDVKFSWKTAKDVTNADNVGLALANQNVAGSVTVSVGSTASAAAIDAANEAAQAASDATDAALAAADAADAATTKAQEAVDAVATLSAQVSKLITALKAQITTLTNLVIKIQKKVKA